MFKLIFQDPMNNTRCIGWFEEYDEAEDAMRSWYQYHGTEEEQMAAMDASVRFPQSKVSRIWIEDHTGLRIIG